MTTLVERFQQLTEPNAAPVVPRCVAHLEFDAAHVRREPDPDSPKRILVTCRTCGAFLGFEPLGQT